MSSVLKNCAIIAGMGAVLVISGAASTDQKFTPNTSASTQSCFHIRDVEGYSPAMIAGHEGVNLRIKTRDVYQMEFVGPCPEAKTASRIRLQANGATDFVCSGADASLVAISEIGPPRMCAINGMRKLDANQVASLPENEVP